MRRPEIITGCFLFLLACQTQSSPPDQKRVAANNTQSRTGYAYTQKRKLIGIQNLKQLDEDTCSIHWYGGDLFSLCFEKNRVSYFFSPQCVYSYRTALKRDKLIIYWDAHENCTTDLGLTQTFKNVKSPVAEKAFGEFRLENDTTLRVKYYFQEWVNKLNENISDRGILFPSLLKLKQQK